MTAYKEKVNFLWLHVLGIVQYAYIDTCMICTHASKHSRPVHVVSIWIIIYYMTVTDNLEISAGYILYVCALAKQQINL